MNEYYKIIHVMRMLIYVTILIILLMERQLEFDLNDSNTTFNILQFLLVYGVHLAFQHYSGQWWYAFEVVMK